ncbi:MAG: hypothetical protein GX684_02975 [Ruminococcaceae bacterium]|nr:hypothetical protein [Oscillospiraceae bacterium]
MTEKKKKKLIDSRILWLIISLLVSFLSWIYITRTQTTTVTREFTDVEVVFEGREAIRELKSFVITDISQKTVSVKLSGNWDNVGSLHSSDIKAVIDVSKLTSIGNNTVPFTLKYKKAVNPDEISLISSYPRTIQFYVDKLLEKPIEVKGAFTGNAEEGYIVGNLAFNPGTINISGPEKQVKLIDHAWVIVDGQNLSREKRADLSFTLRDSEGRDLPVGEVTFDSDTVSITVPISKKKEVPLDLIITPGGGALRDNCKISILPEKITIAGDAALVDGINKIELANIDLSSFVSTYDANLPIILPNGVENVSGEKDAKIEIEILGLGSKGFSVSNLSYINLPGSFSSANIVSRSLDVTIRGKQEILDKIAANNLRAVADLNNITSTGEIYVTAKIYVDGFADVGAVGEYKLIVNIRK